MTFMKLPLNTWKPEIQMCGWLLLLKQMCIKLKILKEKGLTLKYQF